MKKCLLRLSVVILTAATFLGSFAGGVVNAVNEDFDNPDDNIISQNEAQTALLNEQPEDSPEVNGAAYILFDADSGTDLLGLNIDEQREPASTTKVMTCLLAMENLNMSDVITVTPNMYEGISDDYVKIGLTEGEEVTVQDLVYAALLRSANDAALALGIAVSGSEPAFCQLMNQKASEIGCKNTSFTSAYGEGDVNNMTTAYDLALILREALSNPMFSEISTTLSYTIEPTNKYSDAREIVNTNQFVATSEFSYDYYVGGKTGYTDNAGNTIVAAATKNGHTLIGVILGATESISRYSNLISLFEYGFANYSTVAVDESEYEQIYNDTTARITDLLAKTDLQISSSTMELSPCFTTTAARASSGSTNMIELSNVVIDPSDTEVQDFNIPLYKSYDDGTTYIVGSIRVEIAPKDRILSINPEKNTLWSKIKGPLISIIVIAILGATAAISILYVRKKEMKRRREENRKRSKML